MSKLIFATSNKNKLAEAKQILGIEIEGTSLDIPEIQSLDHHQVAKQKALDYFCQLNRPLFIEDTSLSFTALNGLPGTYINDFSKTLGNQGLIDLLANKTDRSATARVTIALIKSISDIQIFDGEIQGDISLSPQGENGFGWDPIFIPKGFNKTFSQMSDQEKNSCSMRRLALEKLAKVDLLT